MNQCCLPCDAYFVFCLERKTVGCSRGVGTDVDRRRGRLLFDHSQLVLEICSCSQKESVKRECILCPWTSPGLEVCIQTIKGTALRVKTGKTLSISSVGILLRQRVSLHSSSVRVHSPEDCSLIASTLPIKHPSTIRSFLFISMNVQKDHVFPFFPWQAVSFFFFRVHIPPF